jgi:hypothetical protein
MKPGVMGVMGSRGAVIGEPGEEVGGKRVRLHK